MATLLVAPLLCSFVFGTPLRPFISQPPLGADGIYATDRANGVVIRALAPDNAKETLYFYDRRGKLSKKLDLSAGTSMVGIGEDDKPITLTMQQRAALSDASGGEAWSLRDPVFAVSGPASLVYKWSDHLVVFEGRKKLWSLPIGGFDVFAADLRKRRLVTISTKSGSSYLRLLTISETGHDSSQVAEIALVDIHNRRLRATPFRTSAVLLDTGEILCFMNIPSGTTALERLPVVVVPPGHPDDKDVIEYGLYQVNTSTGIARLRALIREYVKLSLYSHFAETSRSSLAVGRSGALAFYLIGMYKPVVFAIPLKQQ